MFISKLQISGVLLTGLLVLQGCGNSDELEKAAVAKPDTVNQTQQQMQHTSQPTYIPANPYGATPGQPQGNFRPDNRNMSTPQQYGGGYVAQPQSQSAPTYNSYAPVSGGNTGNPWSQQGAATPSSGTYQGMNQQHQQVPNTYPSTGYQQPGQPQYQYRPLESAESKSSTEATTQRYQTYPPPMQYGGYPSYSQPGLLPYGGMPGGGYPGYSPYGGYGYPQPGNIGMPSISIPGIW